MRVGGEGALPNDVVMIGEAPGSRESQLGRPFCGKSGAELGSNLERAGLPRSSIYLTNLVKEQPPILRGKQQPPSKEQIERDEAELIEELAAARPRWIGAIGRFAARWLAGDLSMESHHALAFPLQPQLRERLRREQIVAHRVLDAFGATKYPVRPSPPEHQRVDPDSYDDSWIDACRVVPIYHVASALHNPELQAVVWWDIRQFAAYVHGKLAPPAPVDAFPNPVYSLLDDGSQRSNSTTSLHAESQKDGLLLVVDRAFKSRLRSSEPHGPPDSRASRRLRTTGRSDKIGNTRSPLQRKKLRESRSSRSGQPTRKRPAMGEEPHCVQARASSNRRQRICTSKDTEKRREQRERVSHLQKHEQTPFLGPAQGSVQLEASPIAVDTEGTRENPWGGSFSTCAGTGIVFRASKAPSIKTFIESASKLILHNSLWDEAVLRSMGIILPWDRVEDSFIMADVLRLVPRGLKAGAQRDCGMEMRGYREVVGPAEKRLAREYVEAAIAARVCWVCDGTGKVLTRLQDGGPKKPKLVQCPDCVDGGLWEPREPTIEYDDESATYKLKRGWEVQRYLRELQKSIDAGKYDNVQTETADGDEIEEPDSPRKRFENWPDEVRLQISRALDADIPEPTLDDVPLREAVAYAGRDADATLRRYSVLRRQIDELGLEAAYRLDLDVMPVAAEIQRNGMRINRAYFASVVEELRERKDNTAAQLEEHIGRRLNPGSPDQVAELLFGKMHLDYTDDDDRELAPSFSFELTPEKWTPTRKRGSTDEKTLEGMKLKYSTNEDLVQAIQLILDWKMCDKVQQFAEKLPRLVDSKDRVHTRIKIGPATFRWASADPNLQQLPVREKHGEDLGRRIREGFEVEEGRLLGSRDFDQIEMRVLAFYAQDAALLDAFATGLDIHTLTASKVFRVPFEAVTKAQRTSAKNIGFGIVYGVTARGLKAQMDLRGQHWTTEECQKLIDSYLYEAYPGVGRFMLDAHAEARQYNMVRSLVGHIRYCPAVHSTIPAIREEALRQAANFKIQCTAAELLKMSERDLYRDCGSRFRELDAKIVMSVHDELIVEAPDDPDTIEEVDALMNAYMTDPYPLDGVSITSGSKWGKTWAKTK
jgi:DNA polymerase I-like protein with 3'-5' exonuclease and polymerase domains/uracil-DNA glycosylase